MKIKQSMQLLRESKTFFVAAVYVLLTLAMTFPVVLRMGYEVPMSGSDTWQAIGQIESQLNVFHAQGISGGIIQLAKTSQLNIFTPYAIFSLAVGLIPAYNIFFLLSFFLSALGAYLLAFYFTKNWRAAFFAGLVFAFAPLHFYHALATHAGMMHQEWLPFFALFLWKFFENLRFKYFMATGFFGIVIAITEHQLLTFTLVFAGLLLIYKVATDRSILHNPKFIAYLATAIVVLATLIGTLFLPYLKVAISKNNFLDAGVGQAQRYSMVFLDPILPSSEHPWWGGVHGQILEFIQSSNLFHVNGVGEKDSSAFVGWSALFLALYAVYRLIPIRGRGKSKERSEVIFWSISALFFFVFALGPVAKIGSTSIYLPYNLVYKYVPFFENIRTTGRFFVYALLSVSVLSAIGFGYLEQKFKNKQLALILFSVILLIEFIALPLKTTNLAYSSFYDQVAGQAGDFKLLEIPGSTSYDFASYEMMTNPIHGKSVINGMALARVIDNQFDFQKSTPIINDLLYTTPADLTSTNDLLQDSFYQKAPDILNYYGIKYVTIQKKFIDPIKITKVEKLLELSGAVKSKYEDDFLVAYEITVKQPEGFYAAVNNSNDKWGKNIYDKKKIFQYKIANNGAIIEVVNMQKESLAVKIRFEARAEKPFVGELVSADGKIANPFSVKEEWQSYNIFLNVLSGENAFSFNHQNDSLQIRNVSFDR